jgi:hypothetical protein
MMGHRFPLCRFVIDYFALLQPLRQYLTRRFVLVLVLVVVLESGHAERWSVGVLEYCAQSEKHPRSGFHMLKEMS